MKQRGYLFLVDAAHWPVMQRWHRLQRDLGVEVALLIGVTARRCGPIAADVVVNAAGPWAGAVARLAGADLPVVPVRRQVYIFQPAAPVSSDLPLVIDPTGVYFRPETGGRLLVGRSFADDPHAFDFTWDRDRFSTGVWPILGRRVPACEAGRLERGWAGLYDMNVVDQTAIVGAHPEIRGLFCLTGFSGHGLQQAPAAARGLAELIATGTLQTLDLSALTPARFATGALLREDAIV